MNTGNIINSVTRSMTFKLMLVGFISLVLLIPTFWIRQIIVEREARSREVSNEISSLWGGKQVVSGPVLSVPYRKSISSGERLDIKTGVAHFLPEILEIDAKIYPSERHRGIFRSVVYTAEINMRGRFVAPDISRLALDQGEAEPAKAALTVGIPDMRGIQKEVLVRLDSSLLKITPGSLYKELIPSGFHTSFIKVENILKGDFNFDIQLVLNGSNSLGFYPLGKTTSAVISSSWPDPSFGGAFLPAKPEISASGFSASWYITHLNRNYPQAWLNDAYSFQDSSFSTDLLLPVTHYRKAERSLKYAIMFIVLTFVLFLLIEILNRKRLHPIQYLMVGLAISVFYILLVSFSEQMPFALAYLISSLAVTILISIYIYGNYQSRSVTATTFLILLSLYGFLFVLLQLQDYSLLFGSIGLFIVLGIFMYLTRKINWYKEESLDE